MVLNSTLMAGLSTIISVVLVSVTAYGYTRFQSKFLDRMFYVVMAVSLFPSIVNLIPLYKIVSSLGWVNTIFAAIVPGFASVTNIFWFGSSCREFQRNMMRRPGQTVRMKYGRSP